MSSFFYASASSLVAPLLSSLGQGAELLLPRLCASCKASLPQLPFSGPLCPLCQKLLALAGLDCALAATSFGQLPVFTAGVYEHELARCILAFKDGGRRDLLAELLPALRRALVGALGELGPYQLPLCLLPVPSSAASIRRRGFAPADLLARGLAASVSDPQLLVYLPALRVKASWQGRRQKELGQRARGQARQGSMRLARPPAAFLGRCWDLEGRSCLLVDDVVTSGASMAEAQRVLEQAGGRVLAGLALARVPLRGRS
ncbi:MAG: hypothetical protein SOR40_03930 [Rothia sp. (in: high G+C Gram-positive bacteria)]|nr:hypothetical protein [Rothia sp. (in: high G+C Gram-positive bacteria)]